MEIVEDFACEAKSLHFFIIASSFSPFFHFFVHFLHFLIFSEEMFVFFSFFLYFFQISFIAGISIRVQLFPPQSVLHGDVVS